MRRFLVLVAFFLLSSRLFSLGTEVQWQVYADFDSVMTLADADAVPTWSFQQNHASVFLGAGQGSPVGIQTDLLRPTELFQLTLNSPGGLFTLGRVLLPFGTFDVHHIYGGRPDEEGTFLPKLWTDFGVVYSPTRWGPLTADFYVMNGMDPSGYKSAGTAPRIFAQASADIDLSKSLGFRAKADLGPSLWVVTSALWEPTLVMAGLDAGYEFDSWGFKAGGIVQSISGDKNYLRWAHYTEVLWKIDWSWSLRLRGGQMDTNSLWITAEDQANVNIGLLWKGDLVECDLLYFRNFTVADSSVVGLASNNHQLLFKVLLSL